jgi:hypothetical protein
MKSFVVAQTYQAPPAQADHLAVGGSDGLQVLTSIDGHLVIHPPEGPAPTEFVSNGL